MPETTFFGEVIRLVDEPSEWAMLEFAEAASGGDVNDLEALAVIMRLLRSCVDPADWSRFRALAQKNGAQVKRDLMPIVFDVITGATDRPTQRPSDSSDGPRPTAASSMADSSSGATDPYSQEIRNLESRGRRDLALFLVDARDQRTA